MPLHRFVTYITLTLTLLLCARVGAKPLSVAYLETPQINEEDSVAIRGVVSTLDSMRMDVVALYGVENRAVVEDIVSRSEAEYSYLHRSINYYDGRDFALLFFADRLFVESVYQSYTHISVEGEVDGCSIILHLARRGDRLRSTLPPRSAEPSDLTLLCGRFSRADLRRLDAEDALLSLERQGYGNVRSKGRWFFRNRVGLKRGSDAASTAPSSATSTDLSSATSKAGVYITDWLVERAEELPIYIVIDTQ